VLRGLDCGKPALPFEGDSQKDKRLHHKWALACGKKTGAPQSLYAIQKEESCASSRLKEKRNGTTWEGREERAGVREGGERFGTTLAELTRGKKTMKLCRGESPAKETLQADAHDTALLEKKALPRRAKSN